MARRHTSTANTRYNAQPTPRESQRELPGDMGIFVCLMPQRRDPRTPPARHASTESQPPPLRDLLQRRVFPALIANATQQARPICALAHRLTEQQPQESTETSTDDSNQATSITNCLLVAILIVTSGYYAWSFLKDFVSIVCITFVLFALFSPA
ncbi:unnamed protein product [Mesocestoides corti]|uniref:Pecanex-like protein n=1 Tax=Mesocestoides corti TaxID=53468 RepID=A0A0R3U6E8_MESCO|nr:unnamed protein product [Mesocestoides corti]